MSKVPIYTLAWSPTTETYELYQTPGREVLRIVPDSPAWFTWLDQVSAFAFVGKNGHYTARKEVKQRGGRYWSAYLAAGGYLTKKYLGESTDLTMARLEHFAVLLSTAQAIYVEPRQEKPIQPPPDVVQTLPLVSTVAAGMDSKGEVAQLPLLVTKLFVPRPRTPLVPRAHLVDLLQQGLARSLTLVSAPAGFGKTTLLAQWLAQSDLPVAWLSLDAEDNDPAHFLSYLIAALQTLDAQLGTTALALLRTPLLASPEAVLAVLISELTDRRPREFALVLDDYHVIGSEPIQRGMTFLLEHLPPQLHLILATRADPPLPLARLRAHGHLTEVRTADLRFGGAEVEVFLKEAMGLDLSPEAMTTLEQRTEGWIAGLQLAALSLQGRSDVSAFLAAFSGSHHYVLDYLSEEVLARQPSQVQTFLLHTCLLERLSGSLCDCVTEQGGSQAMLERLERANLFVVALDDERGWYRYHHLFAQVLRSHLQQREPTLLPVLHHRASAWYEQHNLPTEAVQHALAVPDAELAARLIEPIALRVAFQGHLSTVLGWLHALPEELMHTHPLLCVSHALLLAVTNQLEAAEARLQEAEQGVQKEKPAVQAQIIMGYVLDIRGGIALFSGDIPRAISLAQQAFDLLPEAEVIPRMGALATMIRSYLVSGEVTSDIEHKVAAAVAWIRASNNLFGIVSSLCLLAWLHILQGRLHQAAATYAQLMQVVPQPEVLHTAFSSVFYYFGLGDLLREQNELDMAERLLSQGMTLIKGTLTVEPFVAILGYTALARLEQEHGNTYEALSTLEALLRLAEQRHFAPHLVTQVAAVRANLDLVQGNLDAAIRWADVSGLSATDVDLPYPREYQYLVLARVRLAQARDVQTAPFLQDVLQLLVRLRESAEEKARLGSVLEILIVQALALQAQGDWTSALSTLDRALVLAAPEGYIRLFVDEGEPMLALLRQVHARSKVPGYVETLLNAFGEQHLSELPPPSPSISSLAEPLTEREREVLRLLLEGASNREIAHRLILSVNTVKRHVFNLCGKLGVQSRAQAIIRARDLHLV
jgi:LuxR family maltose regulon positive regulatory protein